MRADTRADTAEFTGRPRNAADMTTDTPDTAAFSIWPSVVSTCVSTVAYFTGPSHDCQRASRKLSVHAVVWLASCTPL